MHHRFDIICIKNHRIEHISVFIYAKRQEADTLGVENARIEHVDVFKTHVFI